jgi:ABC-2 type transport system ATP-binding protein
VPPAITVDNVRKRFRREHTRNSTLKATVFNGFRRTVYDEFWALDGIDLEVAEGSTFGLVGHNGSGKSTLLKCMARIYRPDEGRISIEGRLSALLELGAGFHPELSGRENVYLNGSILGLSQAEVRSRFDDIVEFSGLEAFIDAPVKNYSSGMFVRLGFAVAINVEPEVLLVDEVLAVGDESFQQRCMEKLADLRKAGRTLVVVSHGLDMVRNICDQAAWFDHGKLLETGPAGQIVDAYLASVRDDRRAREAAERGEVGVPGGVWGIGTARLVDRAGDEVSVLPASSPVRIEVEIQAVHEETITVELGVYRIDGVHVAGPVHRYRTGGTVTEVVAYDVSSLPLTAGVYDLAITIRDEHAQVTYASAPRALRFDVVDEHHPDHGGIVALGGRWTVRRAAAPGS